MNEFSVFQSVTGNWSMAMQVLHTGILKHSLKLSFADILLVSDLIQVWCYAHISGQEQDIINCTFIS